MDSFESDGLASSTADAVARRSYGKLVAFLAARTRDVAAAEDALSEAFAAALADCDESLRLRPDDGNTLNSRGLVQFKLGAMDKAAADYDAAVKLSPKDASSLYVRGVIKLKTGDQAGGDADIAAAKAIKASVADDNAAYGVK